MVSPEQAIDRIHAIFGKHEGFRTLHANGRFYTATFTATPAAANLTRAAHMSGAEVPALVRLSNGSGHPRSVDRAPDVRGLAVSFRPVDGEASDLVAQTAPRFPVRTVEEFLQLTSAAANAIRKPWQLALFLARHPHAVPPFVANARAKSILPPRSFATIRYYPIHAYRWLDADGGTRWVRYTFVPDPRAAPAERPHGKSYLHEELEKRLANGPVRMTLQVQIAADGDDPHDPTSAWRGAEVVDVGTLAITAPAPDPEAEGSVVVFDPTRIVDGIELSDDPILRFRPGAYAVSAEQRMGRS